MIRCRGPAACEMQRRSAAIVARAPAARGKVDKEKFAATPKPRPGRTPKPGSRDIPADVHRTVWRRDGGQCAFVAKNGRRCTERSYIEYHHDDPHVLGGEATVENIALRCREHNVYESELIFGPYDPSRVRETPAAYGTSIEPPTGPGTSRSTPAIVARTMRSRNTRRVLLPAYDPSTSRAVVLEESPVLVDRNVRYAPSIWAFHSPTYAVIPKVMAHR